MLSCCSPLTAADSPAQEASSSQRARLGEIRCGLGGEFKVGYWMPVRLEIVAGAAPFSGNLEIVAPDSDDLPTRFMKGAPDQIQLAEGERLTTWRYTKLGKIRGELRVQLVATDGTVHDQRVIRDAVGSPSSWQWVISTSAELRVQEAGVFLARARGERLMTSVLSDAAQFPDRWQGYEGVNAIIVATGDPGPWEQLTPEQAQAFEQWLRLGGRLVISAGRRAPELFASEARWQALSPGELKELDEFWKGSGLENFVQSSERLLTDDTTPLAVFAQTRGRVLCGEGIGGSQDRPFVVQYPFGLGEITYVAVDLELPPLAHWPSRPRLLAKLLQSRSEEEEATPEGEGLGQVTHVGYDDLTGQLRGALDQFAGVTLVRFAWVAALLVLYIALLGPADFFGLRRLGRPQWTWLTFPMIVLAFCALTVWLSHRWKGTRPELNQLNVVDVDVESGMVRGTTWANLYSPRAARVDVDVMPRPGLSMLPESVEVLTSWQGLPGTGLGGMNMAAAGVLGDEYTIEVEETIPHRAQTRLRSVPIATSSSKGVISRWGGVSETLSDNSLLTHDGGMLRGTVTNPLGVDLTQCYVFFENWAYPIDGRLRSGESYELDYVNPLDLKWHLARRRVIQSLDVSTPWDRADLSDPARIAEMLMFHGAAGGRTYTRLTHGYQTFVDLSRQLRVGRAILYGRSGTAATQVTCDGQTVEEGQVRDWTFYRIVIPVALAAGPS